MLKIAKTDITKDVSNYKVLKMDATQLVIKRYDKTQNIVVCDLLDNQGTTIAVDRYFFISGGKKNLPCADISAKDFEEMDKVTEGVLDA